MNATRRPPTPLAEPDSPAAGFGRRLGAMLYDSLLVLALWLTTLLFLVAIRNQAAEGAWVQLLLLLETYGFFAFFWLRRRETLGMLAWRLQIQTEPASAPLTLTAVTLRFIGACLGAAALGLGYLWILFDPARRSWSDLLSDTRVVLVPNRFVEPR